MVPPPRDQILRCGPPLGDRILWCGPPPGDQILHYGPPPPVGSNPTARPLLWDWILRCGPPRVIGDWGSDFLLWPLPGDRTFHCSPSQGIRLSAMAPPWGSDFPLWPLLGDQGLHCGIVQIFSQSMQSPLKWQSVKNVSMVEQYYTKPIAFMLVIYSSLKKKVDPPRGATTWDRLYIRISRRIRIYIQKCFRVGIRGLGDVFCWKKPEAKFIITLSL